MVVDRNVVYVIGGITDAGTINSATYSYNHFRHEFTSMTSSPSVPRAFSACLLTTSAGSKVIAVAGGITGSADSSAVDNVDLFDFIADSWVSATALPNKLARAGSIVIADKLYLFGGKAEDGTKKNSILSLAPGDASWTEETFVLSVMESDTFPVILEKHMPTGSTPSTFAGISNLALPLTEESSSLFNTNKDLGTVYK